MSHLDVRNLDSDDKLLVKLCMHLNYLSSSRMQEIISHNPGKQIFFALSEGNDITSEQFAELLSLKKIAKLCPHCQTLCIENVGNTLFCRKCKMDISSSPNDASQTISIGQQIGKYKILEKIGDGSAGIVYKASQLVLNRVVALKILKLDRLQANSNLLLRFQREAKILASLRHPHIIEIYDVGEESQLHYIAMEYVAGKPLSDYIAKKQFSQRQFIKVAAQVASGLFHAHQHEIIHRDIKPENILITDNEDAKITDFGLARQVSNEVRLTQQSIVIGTPLYMSPEQAVGDFNLGPASDIYSLGVVLYEMLVGRPPFVHDSTLALLNKIVNESPIPPREINASVSIPLQKICMRCLEKKPENRYPNARELQIELEKIYESEGGRYSKFASNTPQSKISPVGISTKASTVSTARQSQNESTISSIAKEKRVSSENISLSENQTKASSPAKVSDQVLVKKPSFKELLMRAQGQTPENEKEKNEGNEEEPMDFFSDPVFIGISILLLFSLAYLFYKLL